MSMAIMIVCGIDMIAYLGLPGSRDEVSPKDFKKWVDSYFNQSCYLNRGEYLYALRCSLVHNYGARKTVSKKDQREVSINRIAGKHMEKEGVIIYNIFLLKRDFELAVKKFLIEISESSNKRGLIEKRLNEYLSTFGGQMFRWGNV